MPLYELSYIENEESFRISLSFSNSVDKLEQSVICNSWTVFGKSGTHDNHTVRESVKGVYPKYFIKEVNFIV